MAMSAVAKATIVHDIVTKLKTFLDNNVTTTNPTFYTAYPEKTVDYPIVTIAHSGFRDEFASIGTEYKQVFITVRIEIWSQSTKERDEIWDEIYNALRDYYLDKDSSGDSITNIALYDMIVLSCMDIDTESPRGMGHIHRKISEIMFTFYAA